jgi:hypothetical protein
MEYRLKAKIISEIKKDGLLYGKIASKMGIQGDSFAFHLRKNSPALTTKTILKLISDHLGIAENDLLEEIEEHEII